MSWFNPRASLQGLDLGEGRSCLIMDDALLEPRRVVDHACAQSGGFQPVDFSRYPGIWLEPPRELGAALTDLFHLRLRRSFDARRLLDAHIRLSLITLQPPALMPRQWLCHVDNFRLPPAQSMIACVLYLFRDEQLGGTGFYEPAQPAAAMQTLWQAADTLAPEEFSKRYGLQPGYLHASNPWFRRIAGVAPRWNRLIFYDGGTHYAAEVAHPERLTADPALGRLTLNGFFTCRRHLR